MSYNPQMAGRATPHEQAEVLRALADELERKGQALPDEVLDDLALVIEHGLIDDVDHSPPPGVLCEDDPDFIAELERRAADVRSGKMATRPLDDVLADLRAKQPPR
jgi:hypothetical protein